jgi:ribosomal protein L11 methyltransferase
MVNDHWVCGIAAEQKWREPLLAFLGELPFDAFEETHAGWDAFLTPDLAPAQMADRLTEIGRLIPFTFQWRALAPENWNARWEANYAPVMVGDFCGIRAAFHPPLSGVRHEIVITPKMAFGTGHHETTRLMIRLMENVPMKGAKVLDFGCGTGVLAILAAKMGATMVDAADIDAAACENTMENAQANNVDSIHVYRGGLERILDSRFDLIVANINRNVILENLPTLYTLSGKEGILLVSGFLTKDEAELTMVAERRGFFPRDRHEQGEWAAVHFQKQG